MAASPFRALFREQPAAASAQLGAHAISVAARRASAQRASDGPVSPCSGLASTRAQNDSVHDLPRMLESRTRLQTVRIVPSALGTRVETRRTQKV